MGGYNGSYVAYLIFVPLGSIKLRNKDTEKGIRLIFII
jgi:hypothetical protein